MTRYASLLVLLLLGCAGPSEPVARTPVAPTDARDVGGSGVLRLASVSAAFGDRRCRVFGGIGIRSSGRKDEAFTAAKDLQPPLLLPPPTLQQQQQQEEAEEEEEEIDSRAWLEAAKNGDVKLLRRGFERDPSLLTESSQGIGRICTP